MAYNGWTNKSTWNVALHIGNNESLYNAACLYMRAYKGRAPYKDFIGAHRGMDISATPDGIAWLSPDLDYKELNEMMREFK